MKDFRKFRSRKHPEGRLRFRNLLAPAILCLVACDIPLGDANLPFGAASRERVVVRLPPLPAGIDKLPDFRFRLRWRDPGGIYRTQTIDRNSSLVVELGRGHPQAILAFPESCGRIFRPAGALYPLDRIGGSAGDFAFLPLDFLRGYTASVWRACEMGGVDPESYDFGRLARELESKNTDPWELLEPSEAASRLAAGRFRSSIFNAPLRFSVQLPSPGPWFPESLLVEPPLPEDGTEVLDAALSAGIHLFYGPQDRLVVNVDEDGSFAMLVY